MFNMFRELDNFHIIKKAFDNGETEVSLKVFTDDISGADIKTRSFNAVASDESIDAMGDRVKVAGWDLKRFKKNPVLMYGHDYKNLPIGRVRNIKKEEKELTFTAEFAESKHNPNADYIYNQYADGFMKAFSVGFSAKEIKPRFDKEKNIVGFDIDKAELLEISAVPIPANENALVTNSAENLLREEEPEMTKEFEEKFLAIEGCITSLKEAVDTLNKNMEEKSKKKPVSEVDGGNPKKVEEEIEEAGKLAKKVNDEDPEEDPEEDPKKKCDDEKSMSDLQMLFKQEGELHTNASEELYLEVFDDTVNATTKEVHELVAEALQSELKKILGKV